jgi:transposase-like protein
MKSRFFKGHFVCPECGSSEIEPNPSRKSQKSVNGFRRRCTCAHCRSEIPVHLAERWGGISIEDARNEWRAVYCDESTTLETQRAL